MKSLFHYMMFFFMYAYGLPKTFSYKDNGDGTISDKVTGLMWEKSMGDPMDFATAVSTTANATTGGHTDWRMPTIKELYSLIRYSGQVNGDESITLFIDVEYFDQPLGNTSLPDGREIDAQTWSNIVYNGTIMDHPDVPTTFGVNFVDGRVKCYPQEEGKYRRLVRDHGNSFYADNQFSKNPNGTVSDSATGLMWMEQDSGEGVNWVDALAFCENAEVAGHNDWRLPTIKELNSIVDYSKGQGHPAINTSMFDITTVLDPDNNTWWPYFWSSTTILDGLQPGDLAVYQTFGRALGIENGTLIDSHGAGAIRADPKNGSRADYPSHDEGFQGDVQYVFNYVRCVRDMEASNKDGSLTYAVVETNVTQCYNDLEKITCPTVGMDYYGQNGNLQSVTYDFAKSKSTNVGLIIGLVIAGVVIIGVAVFCYCRSSKKDSSREPLMSGH